MSNASGLTSASAGRWRRLVLRVLPTDEARAFFGWAAGAFALVTTVLVGLSLRRSDGHLVYVLDDPAIHLAIARNLAEHGTWGVVPGEFQSASSSPVWTVLLATGTKILPGGDQALALAFNVVAALAVLALIARAQTVLRPSPRRPLDIAATAFVAVVVLFLPAAVMVGMEHLLHLALLLAAAQLLLGRQETTSRLSALAPYLLIAVATLTRLETAFFAAGLGAALMAEALPWGRENPRDWRPVARQVLGLALASGLPLAFYGAANRAMGQDWLPSSVSAKSETINGASPIPDLREVMERLTVDPVLLVIVLACVVLAIVGWPNRPRWATLGTAVALTAGMHVTLAQVGWYDRYQIYLIGLGVLALAWAAQALPVRLAEQRPRLVPLFVLVLLIASATKVSLVVEAPRGVADTYEQRFQAARFLAEHYDGEPVATGELGYISLFHSGPITDLYGLGDHEVLVARRSIQGDEERAAFWAELVQRRGVRVVAMYPTNLGSEVPRDWILVGTWSLPRDAFTAYHENFQFFATVPEEVAPLREHLDDFADQLPPEVIYTPNDLAGFKADDLMRNGS